MARFRLEDFESFPYSCTVIRTEAADRLTKLGVPKAPFSISITKLKRIIKNMEDHSRAMVQEVRILKREYDLVRTEGEYEDEQECTIRHHMKRRFLVAAEFHAQLWTSIHELRKRVEQLESTGATMFSEAKSAKPA